MKKILIAVAMFVSLGMTQANAALLFGTVGINGLVVTNPQIMVGNTSVTFSNIGTVGTSSGDLLIAAGTAVTANFMTLTQANVSTFVLNFGGLYTFAASGYGGSS